MAMVRLTEGGYIHPLSVNQDVGTTNFFRAICGPKSPWTITKISALAIAAPTDRVFVIPAIGNMVEPFVSSGGQGVESWVPYWNLVMPKDEEKIDIHYSVSGIKAARVFWGKAKALPDESTIKQVILSGHQTQLYVIFGVLSCVWFPNLTLRAYPPGRVHLDSGAAELGMVQPIRGIWKITDSLYGVRYLSDNVEVMEVVWSN